MGGLHHGINLDNLPEHQPDWCFPVTPKATIPQWNDPPLGGFKPGEIAMLRGACATKSTRILSRLRDLFWSGKKAS